MPATRSQERLRSRRRCASSRSSSRPLTRASLRRQPGTSAGGGVFPSGDQRTLQVGGAAFSAVLRTVSGAGDATIRAAWRRHSDTGDVTGELLSHGEGRDVAPISLSDLDQAFAEIASARVAKQRNALLIGLLERVTADEARYVAKLITGELRIGLREGLVEDAIAVAFAAPGDAVSRAVMLTGDLGGGGAACAPGEPALVGHAAPHWFVPLRPMLATPVADAAEAVARLGEDVWVEDKYDGIRCQLHRHGTHVALYSRDLKNPQFPGNRRGAEQRGADVMLDGEILAFHDGRVMPFHALQTWLGRVSPDAEVMAAVPVIYVAWDVPAGGRRGVDRPSTARAAGAPGSSRGAAPAGACPSRARSRRSRDRPALRRRQGSVERGAPPG